MLAIIAFTITVSIILGRTKAPRVIKKIEKALAVYYFETAHAASGELVADYISVSQVDVENMRKKILTVEVAYMANNGEYEKAIGLLTEFNFTGSFSEFVYYGSRSSNNLLVEEASFFNMNLEVIISEMVNENKHEEAISYCKLYYKGIPVMLSDFVFDEKNGDKPQRWKLDYTARDNKIEKLKNISN